MVKATTSAPSQRMLRVGEEVRHALTRLIQRGEINEPELERVVLSVTEVRMSPDLKIATAFVTAFGHKDMTPLIKALARHARFIRGQMARDLPPDEKHSRNSVSGPTPVSTITKKLMSC